MISPLPGPEEDLWVRTNTQASQATKPSSSLPSALGACPPRLHAKRGRQTSLETTLSEFNYHSNQNQQNGD